MNGINFEILLSIVPNKKAAMGTKKLFSKTTSPGGESEST